MLKLFSAKTPKYTHTNYTTFNFCRDPVMIEWFHEGNPVLSPHGDDHRIVLPDGSLFFLRALRGIDDGNYWCVASNLNSAATASMPASVAAAAAASAEAGEADSEAMQQAHDELNDLTSNRVARSRNATLRVACEY